MRCFVRRPFRQQLETVLILLGSLVTCGCGSRQSTPAPSPAQSPVSRPEVRVNGNDWVTVVPGESAVVENPTREKLAGTWENRQGTKVLTMRFLEPGDGDGPLTRSRDGTARLHFEGFGSVGSTSCDVVFDSTNQRIVFYPPGGVDENGAATAGPFGTPEQAPKPWGTATLIGETMLKVKARISGHYDWVLDTTFVKQTTKEP